MPASPFSVRRFLIIFIIAWIALMADHAALLYTYDLPFRAALTDSIISNILLLGICLLVINTIRYYVPKKDQFMNIIIMCLVLTVIWLLISRWLLSITLDQYEGYERLLLHSVVIRFSIAFLIVGITTAIAIIWYTFQEQQRTEKREAEMERLNKEAELFKIRQQLQPHFLFNSLNSINALIALRPDEARKMVQQLSDFLRGTIRKEENQFISFQEEIDYLKLYLEIEKVRFGYRLTTELNIAEETLNWRLPALLAQPLMENAIKFGLYGTRGEVLIQMKAVIEKEHLAVTIINPFDPDMQMPPGMGFGLKSVQRRLYLLFGRNDLIEIQKTSGEFIVVFRIPYTHE